MRRLLLAAALAAVAIMPATAQADRYCFRSGLVILGEPWLAHEMCVACPMPGGDCPSPGQDPSLQIDQAGVRISTGS